jgi:GDP-L-fucose synthase
VVHEKPPFHDDVEILYGTLLSWDDCLRAARGVDYVIHAAAISGGLRRVELDSVSMFTDNLLMNTQMLAAARQAGVEKYIFISNSSVYPDSPDPMPEAIAWGEGMKAPPENMPGAVKRMGELQCKVYAEATDMKIGIVRGGNAYGPRDNFDLEKSHVIPALVRKAVERQSPFELWGAGATKRDFTHARDIARGILFVLEHYAVCDPVNIATGRGTTIREALALILKAAGHEDSEVIETSDRPIGQASKLLDVSKMKGLGFRTVTLLETGLGDTVAWYIDHIRMIQEGRGSAHQVPKAVPRPLRNPAGRTPE